MGVSHKVFMGVSHTVFVGGEGLIVKIVGGGGVLTRWSIVGA